MKLIWSQAGSMELRACALAFAALAIRPGAMEAQTYHTCPGSSCELTCPAPAGSSCRLALPAKGAYLGIFAYQVLDQSSGCASGVNAQECAIEVREGLLPPFNTLDLGINRPFAFHMHFFPWTMSPSSSPDIPTTLANNPTCNPNKPANELCDDYWHGRVPVIGWKCDQTVYPGYRSSNKAVADGQDDSVIQATRQALAQYPGPVFLRWAWEFNLIEYGSQNEVVNNQQVDYCAYYTPPKTLNHKSLAPAYDDFIAAWQHIWNVFNPSDTANGTGNVMFFWNPNAGTRHAWDDPSPYYPGDEYVDWIGIDNFQRSFSISETFDNDFEKTYDELKGNAKPLMVGANGSPNYADLPPPICPPGHPCPNTNPEFQYPYLVGLLYDLQHGQYSHLKGYDYFDAGGTSGIDFSLDLNRNCITCHPPSMTTGGLEEMAVLGATQQFNATPQVCSVLLDPYNISAVHQQELDVTITVATTANCPWSVGPLPSWITKKSVESQGEGPNLGPVGAGSVTLHIAAPDQPGTLQNVYIGGASATITIL